MRRTPPGPLSGPICGLPTQTMLYTMWLTALSRRGGETPPAFPAPSLLGQHEPEKHPLFPAFSPLGLLSQLYPVVEEMSLWPVSPRPRLRTARPPASELGPPYGAQRGPGQREGLAGPPGSQQL